MFSPESQKKFLHSLTPGDDSEEDGDRKALVFRTMIQTVTQQSVPNLDKPLQICDNVEKVDSLICGDSIVRDLIEERFNKRGKTTKIVKCSGKGLDIIGQTLLNLSVDKKPCKVHYYTWWYKSYYKV